MVLAGAACDRPGAASVPAALDASPALSEVSHREGVEPIPLLDPFALTPVDAGADPLVAHRPSAVDCPTATWGPEGGAFEIQTGACNYAAFDQPLSTPIAAEDALNIIVWHDTIDLPEPATAHVAVWLGRTVVWEAEFAIPAPSRSFEVTVPIEAAPAPEARLGVHLHNHGFNSWRFVAVDVHRH